MKIFWGIFLWVSSLSAMPLKLLVIGDSQSEEYAFELPFSAPNSNPLSANTKNWVEILAQERPNEVTFGSYQPNFFSYPDLRNAGFESNWSVPGSETETWQEVVTASVLENFLYFTSSAKIADQLSDIDAIVIILGGNDANGDYRALQNNDPPAGWITGITDNLRTLIDFIQTHSSQPIYLANIPDVGVTRLVQGKFPDPQKRAIATRYIQQANTAIANLAAAEGATLIDFFSLTERIGPDKAVTIGEVEFLPEEDSENRPRFLLCKDGFHPATATQALLANLVMNALGRPPIPDEEILTDLLGISPDADADSLAWTRARTNETSFFADPDGNGIPNLGEYALNTTSVTIEERVFHYRPEPSRTSYVRINPEISSDLQEWFAPDRRLTGPDGTISINPPRPFFRLRFELQ